MQQFKQTVSDGDDSFEGSSHAAAFSHLQSLYIPTATMTVFADYLLDLKKYVCYLKSASTSIVSSTIRQSE